MPASTSTQSSTPTSFIETSGPSNGVDNQWNQVQSINSDTTQNGTVIILLLYISLITAFKDVKVIFST